MVCIPSTGVQWRQLLCYGGAENRCFVHCFNLFVPGGYFLGAQEKEEFYKSVIKQATGHMDWAINCTILIAAV